MANKGVVLYDGVYYEPHLGGWNVCSYEPKTLKSTINIPNYIENKKVVKINQYAFDGCHALYEVYIGSFVEVVGDGAFRNCDRLNKVFFKNRAKPVKFHKSVFEGCLFLEEIQAQEAGFLGRIVLSDENAFKNCLSLKKLDAGILNEIPAGTFWNCRSLTNLKCFGLTKFESESLIYCNNLQHVTVDNLLPLPDDVQGVLKDVTIHCFQSSNVLDLLYQGFDIKVLKL